MKNNNYAFIDGQNLYLGISANNWKIDLKRFRVYLRDITSEYFDYLDSIGVKEKISHK